MPKERTPSSNDIEIIHLGTEKALYLLPLTLEVKKALVEINEETIRKALEKGDREAAKKALFENLSLFYRGEPMEGEGLLDLIARAKLDRLGVDQRRKGISFFIELREKFRFNKRQRINLEFTRDNLEILIDKIKDSDDIIELLETVK